MSEENILLSRSRYDSIMERLAQFEEERKKTPEPKTKTPTAEQLINNEETASTDMEKKVFGEETEDPSDDDAKSSGREREDIYQDNKDLLPPRGYTFNDNPGPEAHGFQEKKRKTDPVPAGVFERSSPRAAHQRKKKRVKTPRTIKPWISLL